MIVFRLFYSDMKLLYVYIRKPNMIRTDEPDKMTPPDKTSKRHLHSDPDITCDMT